MISESLRAFWVAKSRECGASWEKVDEIWRLFFGFFQAEGERKKEGDKKQQQQQKQHQKK